MLCKSLRSIATRTSGIEPENTATRLVAIGNDNCTCLLVEAGASEISAFLLSIKNGENFFLCDVWPSDIFQNLNDVVPRIIEGLAIGEDHADFVICICRRTRTTIHSV